MQSRLEELERELLEVNANSDRLSRTEAELIELQMVLESAGGFFEEAQATSPLGGAESASFEAPLLESAIPVNFQDIRSMASCFFHKSVC